MVDGGLTLIDSLLTNNHASGLGGGIYASYSDVTLLRNEFRTNSSEHDGGIAWLRQTRGLIANNIIRENWAGDSDSAAIEVWEGSHLDIVNNLFIDNEGNGTADIYFIGSDGNLSNNIFAGSTDAYAINASDAYGTVRIAYNDIHGYSGTGVYGTSDPIGVDGNISEAPLLSAYTNDGDPENDDFSLAPGSPCIDAGDPAESYNDLDGTRNDMGLFGGPNAPVLVDTDEDGMPDRWELRYGLDPNLDDSALDADQDGLSNLEEYNLHTSPSSPDTDSDGINDGDEVAAGSNPTDPTDNRPTADAGEDQMLDVETLVTIDGSRSSDPNGDTLQYQWTFVDLPATSALADGDLESPQGQPSVATFTPDVRGTYTVGLGVFDGHIWSALDTVDVIALGVLLVPDDYETLQEAIEAAAEFERVDIAPGVYEGTITINRPIVLRGAGAETILDGQEGGSVIKVNYVDEGLVRLEHLTLTGGDGDYSSGHTYGGAVVSRASNLEIFDCTLVDNQADGGGAVAALSGGTLTIEGSTFQRNFAALYGGAIYMRADDGSIVGNQVVDNHSERGSALDIVDGAYLVANNLFQLNQTYSPESSGAVDVLEDGSELINNVFSENWGLKVTDLHIGDYEVSVENNIFSGGAGLAMFAESGAQVWVACNNVFGYVRRYGGSLFDMTGRNGNISAPPAFVQHSFDRNPDNDDFHLRPLSPCIDAGDPDSLDPDGSPTDMGMYGGPEAL